MRRVLFTLFICAPLAAAQSTRRVSLDSLGHEAHGHSTEACLSADGRFIAFQSSAADLVAGDTNNITDVFVHDQLSGQTTRVSVSSTGSQALWGGSEPSISADGRFIAFISISDDLVPNDTNGKLDVFVHDRQNGETTRVSVDSSGRQAFLGGDAPKISADGRFVAFVSQSKDLVANDTNDQLDAFVHDCQTGETTRVSVDSFGNQAEFGSPWDDFLTISADGRFVAFESTSNDLVANDSNGFTDTFVHDRLTGETTRISVSSSGAEANWNCLFPTISADGRFVAFLSNADNLVSGDSNGTSDVFLHDRETGVTSRVSVNTLGAQGNGNCQELTISSDGRFVAFLSTSDNLVAGDNNFSPDVFLRDRQQSLTTRLSVDNFGQEAHLGAARPSLSASGRYLVFDSLSDNLVPGDTNNLMDVFLRDRGTGSNQNRLILAGPFYTLVGFPLELRWFGAPPNSNYYLFYSMNLNGTVFAGHSFDLGQPLVLLDSGVNSPGGSGSYTSPVVPSGAAGMTVYFELAARDGNGLISDSIAQPVTFF
ncbi:MAG: calcium-binding protein [Planctomycetota bacterium]|nr:MAG: calcium-binding protein [Planctomycetota bacterium]